VGGKRHLDMARYLLGRKATPRLFAGQAFSDCRDGQVERRFRCLGTGFALQRSGLKTILLHRSNGVPIKSMRKRADHDNLLGLALHVDDAGYDNYRFFLHVGTQGQERRLVWVRRQALPRDGDSRIFHPIHGFVTGLSQSAINAEGGSRPRKER
jgi:hypothetical protein